MNLRFIQSLEELERDSTLWNSIKSREPFSRFSWMGNWFREFGGDLELAVLVGIADDGQWLGIAPFCVDGTSSFARKLRYLGTGSACTDYVGLICAEEHRVEFTDAVFAWVNAEIGKRGMLGRIDVIELEGVSLEFEATRMLCDVFKNAGYLAHVSNMEGCWVLPLPASWDELNDGLSKSIRRKTKKAVSRIAAANSRVYSSDDEPFEKLWPLFVDLHQQRRSMLGQEGCFADQKFENWLKATTRELIEQDMAELVFIDCDDTPFAAMLLFNDGETVFMYQSGLDTTRMNLEPGYQIAYVAIARSIQKMFRGFDFMRGDEPYKSRWNSMRVPLSRLRLIPPTSVSRFKHRLWLTGRTLKRYAQERAAVPPETGPRTKPT